MPAPPPKYANRRPVPPTLPSLPQDAQQPAPVSLSNYAFPSTSGGYTFQVTPPAHQESYSAWDTQSPSNPPRQRASSMQDPYLSRPHSGRNSVLGPQRMAFPEPTMYQLMSTQQRPTHYSSRSDVASSSSSSTVHLNTPPYHQNPSVASFASSYNGSYEDSNYGHDYQESFEDEAGDLAKGLSDLSLASEEGLRRFQAGELPEKDQEWHRLVPTEARDALGKQEVQRQSVIFEVIKSEREYVADLETVEEVFVERLRKADPPIIKEPYLTSFLNEVFGNLRQILSYHQGLLAALFARQREQHPLIQSVADIVLDTTLKSEFRIAYETYIKHYPLSESHHRKQLKRNRAYEVFIQSVSNDPRIRKRDLITFLSRPVTKLPRLNLLLEQILKLTNAEYEHPDLETLPLILGILKDFIKSTQPGIEAAESKVKFWALCESLVFQKGELLCDMDLYDESRTLVYTGPVLRRVRTETGFSEKWSELVVALLDNYFMLMREEKRPNGSIKRLLMSRPMPLSFLRLGSFNAPPEMRREKTEDGSFLDSLRSQSVPVYPFTIYHAANKTTRRYTLYVASDALRKKWYNQFVDAMGVHNVRQESNMWFNPQSITDGFFRTTGKELANGTSMTGKIHCAVPFVIGSKRFLAVGCGPGIYAGPVNSENFRLVLNLKSPTSLAALTTFGDKTFNRLVVHVDNSIVSYSLDILARLALGQTHSQTLEASAEKVASKDTNVMLCRHLHVTGRSLLIYASKRRLATSMNVQVLEAVGSTDQSLVTSRKSATSQTFRPFGEAGYMPKDAYDVVSLAKTIGVCTSAGIITLDPTNIAHSSVAAVPDLTNPINSEPLTFLKSHVEGLKPLGFVRVDSNELLVIYDELGFYIDKHGLPTRRYGYIKWEGKAVSYAYRNGHIILVSPQFIEIRSIATGRVVQVIEGHDIRLLYSGPYTSKEDPVLVAMRGGKDDKNGASEKIAELIQTEEISLMTPATAVAPSLWDEWDM
ncbi:hypothetical protein CPB84DRAFT_1842646 [Gymnopilus junonius]|uniref:Rho1 guanine nucleotide exchange factor 1 n=1 Tax=Gymnopilus junonius TaxID=109634 RepID=A0A9P5TS71_GYMJU|nr:hypothetical protein CPB84DRAFT_1842646 [Gymnopilus junonius]